MMILFMSSNLYHPFRTIANTTSHYYTVLPKKYNISKMIMAGGEVIVSMISKEFISEAIADTTFGIYSLLKNTIISANNTVSKLVLVFLSCAGIFLVSSSNHLLNST